MHRADIPIRYLWAAALVGAALLMIGMKASGLSIDIGTAGRLGITIAAALLISASKEKISSITARRIAEIFESIGLLSLLGLETALGSYVIAANTLGFQDAALAQADHIIGFDWVILYRFIVAHPTLAVMERMAYLSIFYTPTVIVLVLALNGYGNRLHQFIAASAISYVATLAIFYAFPAKFALAYYLGTGEDYIPVTGIQHLQIIADLRSGALKIVDLGTLAGLISFSSVHTIAALLFIWASWPIPKLRYPILIINCCMLLSVPVEGAHYFVDVVTGALVAGAAIWLMNVASKHLNLSGERHRPIPTLNITEVQAPSRISA